MQELYKTIQIPDEIYGREEELVVLQEAFRWASLGSTELVVISGQPGLGKTSLVQKGFKSTVIGACKFATGKFDQYSTGIPYEPLIKCFQIVIRQMLTEPEPVLQAWSQRVKEVVGPNSAVITELIPEAELLLKPELPLEELPPIESQNRFESVFCRFVQVFGQMDHPLVLFFDDVQWADEASLRLLHSLIVAPESQNLLVIAAYREQESMGNIEQWLLGEHTGYSVRRVSLKPLDFGDIQKIVAASLGCSPSECLPLAHLFFAKSVGNPLYLKQLLKMAYDEQYIQFNAQGPMWEWQLDALKRFPDIDGQMDYLVDRINKIPMRSKELLVTSACLGNNFNAALLTAVSGHREHELVELLSPAVKEGLLVTAEDTESIREYQFTHDKIQQAAYSILDHQRLMEVHHQAGHYLLKEHSSDKEALLFDIVNHYNHALGLLSPKDREMVAALNEEAGRKALQSSAYSTALHYFTAGIECVPESFWNDRFEFMFQLHLKCAECAYLCGLYEQADAILNKLLKQTHNWSERVQVYKLKIERYSNTGNYSQAIDLGLQVLRDAGIRISEQPHKWVILKEVFLTKRLLNKRMEELPTLPEVTDPQAKGVMELLVALVAPTFFFNRSVFAIIASKFIRLVYDYGSSSIAPSLYAAYGMLLGTTLGQYQMGYRLGQIAIDLADRSGVASIKTKVHVMFYGVISPWVRFDRDDEVKLEQAARLGLEAGDYVYASYAIGSLINLSYVRDSMDRMFDVNRRNLQLIEQTKEDLVFKNALIYMELAKSWRCSQGEILSITDGRTGETEFLEEVMKDEGKAVTLYQVCTYKAQMYYLFGYYRDAVRLSEQANPYEHLSSHAPHLAEHHFYEALSIAAAWGELSVNEKRAYSKTLKRRYRQFKAWDRMSPENFRHKLLLIQAEIARLKGNEQEMTDLYDRSIQFARERNYAQYQAVGCELAAKYHLQKGRERIALGYIQEAYEMYGVWGAESKRYLLKAQYPQWLQETISNQSRASTVILENSLEQRQQNETDISGTSEGLELRKEPAAKEIDFGAIVKASLSLSQGLDLKELQKHLLQIIMETSNAEKGCLLVLRNGNIRLEAVMRANGEVVDLSRALEDSEEVPVTMIQYTSRLGQWVQSENAVQDDLFQTDPYIIRNQSRTVCCLPLFLQEQLSGMLYLEDNRSCRFIADDRITTIRILASQALFVWKLSGSFGDTSISSIMTTEKQEEDSVDSLTDRELEVLNLMASGMTNKEIAYQLGVTAGTVKVHIHNIFSKLNVNRRTKAIAEAKKKKILI
ncbi:helix-turn-helix transcriptional regulator [Paenibacillus sp. RC67]|uniref:helix-turn-helix transcriptional regulator n=1 Tax=Paenibacillus sp. RC67 TaxID=3039392 RepID=UPI0024ADB960|nr:helix-turn-helix transcriptional regulator [Paenibacillus sp. RC67]